VHPFLLNFNDCKSNKDFQEWRNGKVIGGGIFDSGFSILDTACPNALVRRIFSILLTSD